MTIPYERSRAVKQAEEFLMELCDPKKTPRVPKQIRQQAKFLLRHYPGKFDMEMAARQAPDLFAEKFL